MINLTAHWFDEMGGNMRHAILNTSEFPGSHTGERTGLKMHEMLRNWNIATEQVHLILRDNAANMIKGLDTAELTNAGCFIQVVIPYVATLTLFLEKPNSELIEVEPTKETLLKSLKIRFKHIFDDNVFTLATVLDPRFKLNFIPGNIHRTLIDQIIGEILNLMKLQQTSDKPLSETPKQAISSPGFWKCFEQIGASQPRTNNPSLCTIKNELQQYLSEGNIERKQSPYVW